MEQEIKNRDRYINLSNLAELTTLSILILVIFAVVRTHTYYQLLLHIPIFQYMDASDLIMMTPATGVIWIFYLGCINLSNFIIKSPEFDTKQRILFPLFLYGIVGWIVWTAYHNDPVIKQVVLMPLGKYWYLYFGFLILFLFAYQFPDVKGPLFFQKNKFIIPLIVTVWYGLYEGYANFQLTTSSKHVSHMVFKQKSGIVIATNNNLVYAGRTKEYWFLYNRKTHMTRVLKNDDIGTIDFD